jgi:hypothetical protein
LDAAELGGGRVAAEGAVLDSQRRVAAIGAFVGDAAAVGGRVAADGAVLDGQRRVAKVAVVVDAAAEKGRVAADGIRTSFLIISRADCRRLSALLWNSA